MEQRAAMTWARRLKRVFGIDISECEKCKGPVRIVACIEDPDKCRKWQSRIRKLQTRQRGKVCLFSLYPPLTLSMLPGVHDS